MVETACHAVSNIDAARNLLLKVYGPRRVALWCDRSEAAIYQWLSRATEAEPIPPEHVPKIILGARAEGLEAPLETLWPAMAEILAADTQATAEMLKRWDADQPQRELPATGS